MRNYYVPVSFYVEAFDEADARRWVLEYLENAAACVQDYKYSRKLGEGIDFIVEDQVAPCPDLPDLDAPHFLPEDFAV
jgi:uncharacterized protein involved in type VI secretion and phage assembly